MYGADTPYRASDGGWYVYDNWSRAANTLYGSYQDIYIHPCAYAIVNPFDRILGNTIRTCWYDDRIPISYLIPYIYVKYYKYRPNPNTYITTYDIPQYICHELIITIG